MGADTSSKRESEHGKDYGNTLLYLEELREIVKEIARGDASGIKTLFALSNCHKYPDLICETAEAFGMMLVKVEAREAKLYDIIKELQQTNRKLEDTSTKLSEACQELRIQAIRDPLTGLYNRRYMEESLSREAHRALRQKKALGIMMLDVDHFKMVNDHYGHDAGDAVLKALGGFIRNHIRAEDIACRYGGEEFLIIIPDISLDNLCHRAEDMRQGIQDRLAVHYNGHCHKITISIGAAAFPNHGDRVETVLNKADAALYQAKAKGRNQVILVNRPCSDQNSSADDSDYENSANYSVTG